MEIFVLVLIGLIAVCLLGVLIYLVAEKYPSGPIFSCALFICAFVLAWIYGLDAYRRDNKPEFVYEQKVQAMQKAERELQNFLIDHPEFKEIKE